MLITHCAPWLGHVNDDIHNPEFREFPGTLTLWKWLGLRRFFPEGKEIQENSRGCAAVSRPSTPHSSADEGWILGLSGKLYASLNSASIVSD